MIIEGQDSHGIYEGLILPSPNGLVRAGNLKKGDKLFTADGKPCTVTEVVQKTVDEIWEMLLMDKRRTKFCGGTILQVFPTGGAGTIATLDYPPMYIQASHLDLKASQKRDKYFGTIPQFNRHGEYTYQIQRNKAVRYPKQEYNIPPYIMGLLLGKARTNAEQVITTMDKTGYVEAKLAEYFDCTIKKIGKLKAVYRKNSSEQLLTSQDIFTDEEADFYDLTPDSVYIPYEYLMGSIEQRWQLFQGLFDAMALISVQKRELIFHTSFNNPQFRDDILELAWGLGIAGCMLTKQDPEDGKEWSLHVNADKDKAIYLATNPDKIEKIIQMKKLGERSKMTKLIARLGIREIYNTGKQGYIIDFITDSPNHMFLTNDYILMHDAYVD